MLIENLSFPMDRRMYQQALALRDHGYQVRVICPKGEKTDCSSMEVVDGIRVYRYKLHVEASGASAYLLEYGWAMIRTFLLMLRIFFTEGFDIVHAANPPDMFFALAILFKLLGRKFVFDQHDLCPETYETKFQRRGLGYQVMLWLERLSYRTADLVIAPNLSFHELIRSRGGVPAHKICIVRSGPDLRRFRQVPPQPELKRGFRYLVAYLGVMGRQDGVDRVVRAAHYLIKRVGRRDVSFVCIGKGECWEELRELAKQLDISDYVKFTGRIPDAEVMAYLSTADVCAAPDPPLRLNDVSTMNKVLEYMACHKPIVSFDLTESRRSAEAAAVYVERDDVALFANAIDRLLDNEELRGRMGEIGYERICGEVSWERSKANLVEGYGRLFASPGHTSPARLPLQEPLAPNCDGVMAPATQAEEAANVCKQ